MSSSDKVKDAAAEGQEEEGRITIFSLKGCPHCNKAKALFSGRGWTYYEVNLTDYPEKRQDMLKLADRLTVPQIFFNNKHLGGNSDLEQLDKSGQLEALYQEVVKGGLMEGQKRRSPLLARPNHEPVEPAVPLPLTEQTISIGGQHLTYEEIDAVLLKVAIEDRTFRLKNYKACFLGSDLVTLLCSTFKLQDRAEAVQVGELLLEGRFFAHVTQEHRFEDSGLFYRLHKDWQPHVLNSARIWTDRVDKPMVTVTALKKTLSKILSDHTDGKDGLIDFQNAGEDARFAPFEIAVCEFQGVQLSNMERNEKIAFVINVYNLLALHAFVVVGAPNTNVERLHFFDQISYNIGGLDFTLNQLESGILRSNRHAPYHMKRPFSAKSVRHMAVILQTHEPRVHFALNCGGKSCPPIKTFTAEAVQEELRIVAMAFLEQDSNCKVDVGAHTLHLSKIFSWYSKDFGANAREIATTFLPWLRGEKREAMEALLGAGSFKVRYFPYDWTTAAKPRRK